MTTGELFDACDSLTPANGSWEVTNDATFALNTIAVVNGKLVMTFAATPQTYAHNFGGAFYKRPSSISWNFLGKELLRFRITRNSTLSANSLANLCLDVVADPWVVSTYLMGDKITVTDTEIIVDIDLRYPTSGELAPDLSSIRQFGFSIWEYVAGQTQFTVDTIELLVPPFAPLQASITPNVNKQIFEGDQLVFNSQAIGGTRPYTYAWYVNGILEATTQSFTFSKPNAGQYDVFCEATDADGSTAQSSVITVTVTVLPLPIVPTMPNAMLIYDQSWLAMNQNILSANLPKVIRDLSYANCQFAIIFVGYWNSTDSTHPTISWIHDAAFYQNVINQLHAIGVKAIAWVEDDGWGVTTQMDIRPANRQNIYPAIIEAMNMGFDGYFDDIENPVGTHQDQIDWWNSLTSVLHTIGKLNMPAVGYDWQQNTNQYLYVDYIVTLFYSNRSTFEDPQGEYYWQENFGEYSPPYAPHDDTPPASPVILCIMNSNSNQNPLSWQLSEAVRYLQLYGHPNLYGFGVWLYEYMGTNANDWTIWDEWVKTLAQYGVPPPSTTIQHVLSIASTTGGTTDPASGSYNIYENTTQQVVAIPDAGYMFDRWEIDGVNVGSVNPHSVFMDRDHSIFAVFTELPPPPPQKQHLTIIGINGQTDPAQGTYELDKDSSIIVTATANQGFKFKHWLFDNVIVGLNPTIAVVMDTDHTLVAVCEAVSPTPITSSMLLPALGLLVIVGIGYLATRKKR